MSMKSLVLNILILLLFGLMDLYFYVLLGLKLLHMLHAHMVISRYAYIHPPRDPGRDYKHWGIFFYQNKKPGGKYATKQQMIDCYVQTLAKIVGSEEEAKRKIYKVSFDGWYGFGCETDPDKAEDLCELCPQVHFVSPDSYVDPEYKDYGCELFVNGEVVPRPPERKRKIYDWFLQG